MGYLNNKMTDKTINLEKQQLEELIEKYEIFKEYNRYSTRQIKNWKQGREYDLAYTDSRTIWSPDGKTHYHFSHELYLIYKPQSAVCKASQIGTKDFPFPPEEIYTELELEEQEKQVIVKWLWNIPKIKEYDNPARKENRTSKFQWVATIKQGEKEPTYEIVKLTI